MRTDTKHNNSSLSHQELQAYTHSYKQAWCVYSVTHIVWRIFFSHSFISTMWNVTMCCVILLLIRNNTKGMADMVLVMMDEVKEFSHTLLKIKMIFCYWQFHKESLTFKELFHSTNGEERFLNCYLDLFFVLYLKRIFFLACITL